MIERASPVQLRKALEVANLLTKMGIGFVPVPVANSAEYDKLAQEVMEKMDAMAALAESEEANAGATGESKHPFTCLCDSCVNPLL